MDALTELARDGARGDASARDHLVRRAYGDVWRLCAALVDRQSADDLAQETFVRAVRALPRFRAESSARTWLLAITRRASMDELRARRRRRQRDANRAALRLDREPLSPDASDGVTLAPLLAQLEPERRLAFVLTQEIGLSYAETAVVCDCAIGTIRSRVARARAELIDLIRDRDTYEDEESASRWPPA